jgi:hypothetical protein
VNGRKITAPFAILVVMGAGLLLSFVPLRSALTPHNASADVVTAVIVEARALGTWHSGPRALIAAPVRPDDLNDYGLARTSFDSAELPLSLVLLSGEFAPGNQLPSATMREARYMVVVYSRSQRRPVLVSLSKDGARYRPLFAAAQLTP